MCIKYKYKNMNVYDCEPAKFCDFSAKRGKGSENYSAPSNPDAHHFNEEKKKKKDRSPNETHKHWNEREETFADKYEARLNGGSGATPSTPGKPAPSSPGKKPAPGKPNAPPARVSPAGEKSAAGASLTPNIAVALITAAFTAVLIN
jgi:hypothetical protein